MISKRRSRSIMTGMFETRLTMSPERGATAIKRSKKRRGRMCGKTSILSMLGVDQGIRPLEPAGTGAGAGDVVSNVGVLADFPDGARFFCIARRRANRGDLLRTDIAS